MRAVGLGVKDLSSDGDVCGETSDVDACWWLSDAQN